MQEVYIGSGAHALASRPRPSAARETTLLALEGVNTFYGKSHILRDVTFDVREHEIVALLGRNGAGKSTLLKTIIGIAPPATGEIAARRATTLARRPSGRRSRAAASPTCRRGAACSPA